jgi:hypothetical protein
MRWDADVEGLVEKVRSVFGDDAVADALLRALLSVTRSRRSSDALEQLPDEFANNTKVVDRRLAQEAFRVELQRLLRLH